MLRRTLLLSALTFPLTGLTQTKTAGVVYFTWYHNVDKKMIRQQHIDAFSGASLLPDGMVGQLANAIGRALNLPVYPIEAEDPYSVVYEECLDQAIKEKTASYRPKIKSFSASTEFDLLFLGFPNWSYTLPMPVCTFLGKLNSSPKQIAPFCVHGTGGLARTIVQLRRCAPKAKILKSLSIYRDEFADADDEAVNWAKKIWEANR